MVKPFFDPRYQESYQEGYHSIYQSEKTFFDVENSIDRAICSKKRVKIIIFDNSKVIKSVYA